jgi:hypothetical protein
MPDEEILNQVEAVVLSKEKRTTFAKALALDIAKAREARETFDEKLIKWDRQYEAIPEQERKNFPWMNCSNVVAPLTAIAVDAVEARLDAELIAKPEIVKCRSLRGDELKDIADPMERFLNHAAKQGDDLDTENCMRDTIPDTVLNGISFVKCPYVYEEIEVPDFDRAKKKIKYRKLVKHNGPKHLWVSVTDMLWPEGTVDIQRSRWLAQRFWLEWWQVRQRIADPAFAYDKDSCNELEKHLETKIPKDVKAVYDNLQLNYEPSEKLEFYEVYIITDVKERDKFEKHIVTIHPESETIVKHVKHFYAHQLRPFVPFFYRRRRKTIIAQGIGSMLERLQDGVTTSMNQMIDNSTAANTVVLKVKKGSLRPNEEIYPMKKLMLDDMADVDQFRLGENSTGMTNAIGILRDYAERRSGVTDYHLGMESSTVGTRATAAGTMSLIQEGNRQIDRTTRTFRQSMTELWEMTVAMYQQFAPTQRVISVLDQKDAAAVMTAFTFPTEWLFDKIAIDVIATSPSANTDLEKQNAMQLFQMLGKYYEQIIQVSVMYMQMPPLVKLAIDKSVKALNELLEKILRKFDQFDVDNFMIQLSELEMAAAQMGGMQNAGGNNGPGAGAPPGAVPGQAGMGGPPAMAGGPPGAGGRPMLPGGQQPR